MWNIESSDDIPVVLEHRKNIGLRIVQVCFKLKAGFHMMAAIATFVVIARKKLSNAYVNKFPYDHYRIKKMPERTWNKHHNDRYNLWRVVSI